MRIMATAFAAIAITLSGVQVPAGAQSVETRLWTKLAGTAGKVDDRAGTVKLASYSLIFDAGQQYHGYLRMGGRFVKTRYREALVAPGQRWVAGIPDPRLWLPQQKIDLIDRKNGRTHPVRLPAPATSPEWSPDGRTLLLTAYDKHRDGSLTIIGFITMNVADRVPRLVKAGPRHRVANWSIGREFRFYFAGTSRQVLAVHGKNRISLYGMNGKPRKVYKNVGGLAEWTAATVFSPSGRLFATVLRTNDKGSQIGIVEASTGKILHRTGQDIDAFAGWYDDEHIIVRRFQGRNQVVFQRADLSGKADLDLIRERLIVGVADYAPHLERVNFVR
ncbi:hypothetical protein ACIBKY_46255 [Nonomuraea sp. NPDC050394]|uniref:hypothetical protein n=1 Tax=Nonomuraea sp. NPDC050394 TaxID=3364363 RepID=UPI0037998532